MPEQETPPDLGEELDRYQTDIEDEYFWGAIVVVLLVLGLFAMILFKVIIELVDY